MKWFVYHQTWAEQTEQDTLRRNLTARLQSLINAETKHNEAIAAHIIGDVEGKVCLMFDDMIDTAEQFVKLQNFLNVKVLKLFMSEQPHAVFSGPAIERLKSAPIEECIVTNTIPWNKEDLPENVKQLSIAPLLGQAISRIR